MEKSLFINSKRVVLLATAAALTFGIPAQAAVTHSAEETTALTAISKINLQRKSRSIQHHRIGSAESIPLAQGMHINNLG